MANSAGLRVLYKSKTMHFAVGSSVPIRRSACFLFESSNPFVSVDLVPCWPGWPWLPFVWFLRILHTSVLRFRSHFFEILVFILFWIVTLLMCFVSWNLQKIEKKNLKRTKLSFHSYFGMGHFVVLFSFLRHLILCIISSTPFNIMVPFFLKKYINVKFQIKWFVKMIRTSDSRLFCELHYFS